MTEPFYTTLGSNGKGTLLLAAIIIAGSGLLAYGVQQTTIKWEKDINLPGWFSVAGGALGVVLAMMLGALVGFILWNWQLGLVCGSVGGWSSDWVVSMLTNRFGKSKKTDD